MTQLFRPEALRGRCKGLGGEVVLAFPRAWLILALFMLAALLTIILFLARAAHTRTHVAAGIVVLDRGVAPIIATRPGVLLALADREGTQVKAGSTLAIVRSGENASPGRTGADVIENILGRHEQSLTRQVHREGEAAAAAEAQLEVQIEGMAAESRRLEGQIDMQRRLIRSASDELDAVLPLAEKGYVSGYEISRRRENLLIRERDLLELLQTRDAKLAAQASAVRQRHRIRAEAQGRLAEAEAKAAEIDVRRADARMSGGYMLAAPVAGRITAVRVKKAQAVAAGETLMLLVPKGARPRAELQVPASAVSFIRPGQEVRLSVDAFPATEFGWIVARVAAVSRAAPPSATSSPLPLFIVTVDLPRPWIVVDGERHQLMPGMTLTARIATHRKGLAEKLLRPILAVLRR